MKQSRRRKKKKKKKNMNKIISWRADKISFKKQTKSWHAVEEKNKNDTIRHGLIILKTYF